MSTFAPLHPHRFTPEDYAREETYRLTRPPVEAATTLIPDAFRSPEFYALEQEKIFATGWVVVGCTSQVSQPGDILVASVAGQSILVTRNKAGELRAFYNVCRHRGSQLVNEARNVKVIRCPYHSWGYDLNGNCIGTPLFEGSDIPEEQRAMFDTSGIKKFDKADYGLLPVRVESWGCLIFVNLVPGAPPLAEWLGDLPQRMGGYRLHEWEIQRRKTYEFKANWKLVAENFMEYYHLPWVHPELIKVSRMEDHYRWQGPGLYTGMTTSPVSQDTESGGWLSLPPITGLNASDSVSGRFLCIFPNVTLSVLPNHIFMMQLIPDGPNHTLEETYLLSHPDSLAPAGSQAALDKLMSFWDLINKQDVDIVEQVQRGLESTAYTGGRMCFRFEEPIHRFQNMVIDRMVGQSRIPPGDEREGTPIFDSAKLPVADSN